MANTGDQDGPTTGRRRLRRFRVPVLVLALLAATSVITGVNALVDPVPALALPVGIGLAVAAVVLYRRLSRAVELRADVPEVATAGLWSLLGRGTLLGVGLFTALMLLIAMFGGWQEVSWRSFGGLVAAAGTMAGVAVIEEILFRGVVFRVLEEHLGTALTLLVSALLFGAIHLVNANATVWGALSIALTGGLMLAAAYVVTRSLWLPIGLHFGWNLAHSGVFGVALSGTDTAPRALLAVVLDGPAALTGGVFGPEASLFALVVCLVPTVLMLRRAARTGRIRPRPRRASVPAAPPESAENSESAE